MATPVALPLETQIPFKSKWKINNVEKNFLKFKIELSFHIVPTDCTASVMEKNIFHFLCREAYLGIVWIVAQ